MTAPSQNIILQWANNPHSGGSLLKTKQPGNPQMVHTSENEERVRIVVLKSRPLCMETCCGTSNQQSHGEAYFALIRFSPIQINDCSEVEQKRLPTTIELCTWNAYTLWERRNHDIVDEWRSFSSEWHCQ